MCKVKYLRPSISKHDFLVWTLITFNIKSEQGTEESGTRYMDRNPCVKAEVQEELFKNKKGTVPAGKSRLQLWKTTNPILCGWKRVTESLPLGYDEGWLVWKYLNRLRSRVGKFKLNLAR